MNRFETMYELRGNPKTKLLFNFVSLCLIHDVWAQEYCYTSGGVFGLIVLSVFTTLFVIALTFALFWFLWTKNLLKLGKCLILIVLLYFIKNRINDNLH